MTRLLLLAALTACGTDVPREHAGERTNVLLICVDDLRPDLGCLDLPSARTPNLDGLAARGRLFRRHYIAVPTCGASRLAMLTGLRPNDPVTFGNRAFELLAREGRPDRPESFAAMLRDAGYTTVSIGKVTHAPDGRAKTGVPELPHSWDEVGAPHGRWPTSWDAFFGYADGSGRVKGESPPFEQLDSTGEDSYPDSLIADAAVEKIGQLTSEPAPFLLAVGFYKPHLPWCSPGAYWDLHPMEGVDLPANPRAPLDTDPSVSLHRSGELRGNYVRVGETRELRRAYRAAVSYADAQVGRVLDALDRSGASNSTVVVVWSDHGWHLGDHGIWGKHTLHERSLRSPLILRVPGMKEPGEATDAIAESVDLYPTLAALCGIDAPKGLDGRSLVPLLHDPDATWNGRARSFWSKSKGVAGESLRTDRWRLTRWTRSGEQVLVELYDHQGDPEESANVVEEYPEVVEGILESAR